MLRNNVIILLTISFLNHLTIRAQPETLTLQRCIEIALRENPLISAASHHYDASQARINQARAWSQPTINLDSDLQPYPLDFRGAGESYLGIGQSLLFPGKRKINTEIARKESEQVLMESEQMRLELTYLVKLAFFRLMAVQDKLEYMQRNLELAEDFLNKTLVKFETGDGARVEVIRAQVESARVTGGLRETGNEVAQARADLNFLMGRDRNSHLEISNGLTMMTQLPPLDELSELALANRPEIRWIRSALEREALVLKQAGLSYLPDLDLGLSRHTIAGDPKTWDFTIAMPVPLYFGQIKKGQMAESRANLKALGSELASLENNIRLEVESAFRDAEVAKNLIELFNQEMLDQAEEVYNLLLYSYQEGEITGIELIEARKTYIETRLSFIDATYQYDAAVVTIEKSIGRSLEGK